MRFNRSAGIFFVLYFIAYASGAVNGTSESTGTSSDYPLEVNFAVFDYPPLYHATKDGGFSGILGETFKALCDRANLTCHFHMLPVSRAYKSLLVGHNQILISGKHPKFEKCCTATQWSYPWTSGIFSKRPLAEIPTHGEELIGKSLIVLRGWIAPYVFEPSLDAMASGKQVALYKAASNYSAIRMLQSDRAQFLYGATEFRWYFDKMGLNEVINFQQIRTMPLVLWVSTERVDILRRLDYAFRALKE
ncbi:MAG: hypothetical protein GY779_02900, partial [Gammaproteobacteria bacterium]|nr:hypothetical protein [Gammaproteobacteria bacterium]